MFVRHLFTPTCTCVYRGGCKLQWYYEGTRAALELHVDAFFRDSCGLCIPRIYLYVVEARFDTRSICFPPLF